MQRMIYQATFANTLKNLLSKNATVTTTRQPITLYHRKGISVNIKQYKTRSSAIKAARNVGVPETFFK